MPPEAVVVAGSSLELVSALDEDILDSLFCFASCIPLEILPRTFCTWGADVSVLNTTDFCIGRLVLRLVPAEEEPDPSTLTFFVTVGDKLLLLRDPPV